MDLYSETLRILKKYNLQANKKLGQNFLINEQVVSEIIERSSIEKEDIVIEIGPGLGTLTKELLERAYCVIAVEIDNSMINVLQDRFFNYKNLMLINDDVLNVDLNKIIYEKKLEAEKNGVTIKNVKIVANLPYYISSPIVLKLLEEHLLVNSIIIMVQKEVAQRIIAEPGSKLSGSISYVVDYYTESEKIIDVKADSFVPPPKVESEVIKLNIREKTKIVVDNEKELFKFIQLVLSQRRKTLSNVLVNINKVNNKEEAIKILNSIGLKEDIRGETLSLEKFAELKKVLDF